MARRRRRRSELGKLLNSLLRDLGCGRDHRTPILGAKTNNKPWEKKGKLNGNKGEMNVSLLLYAV